MADVAESPGRVRVAQGNKPASDRFDNSKAAHRCCSPNRAIVEASTAISAESVKSAVGLDAQNGFVQLDWPHPYKSCANQ
jgi:hypothetical protein